VERFNTNPFVDNAAAHLRTLWGVYPDQTPRFRNTPFCAPSAKLRPGFDPPSCSTITPRLDRPNPPRQRTGGSGPLATRPEPRRSIAPCRPFARCGRRRLGFRALAASAEPAPGCARSAGLRPAQAPAATPAACRAATRRRLRPPLRFRPPWLHCASPPRPLRSILGMDQPRRASLPSDRAPRAHFKFAVYYRNARPAEHFAPTGVQLGMRDRPCDLRWLIRTCRGVHCPLKQVPAATSTAPNLNDPWLRAVACPPAAGRRAPCLPSDHPRPRPIARCVAAPGFRRELRFLSPPTKRASRFVRQSTGNPSC
jgi:hypothetical protein